MDIVILKTVVVMMQKCGERDDRANLLRQVHRHLTASKQVVATCSQSPQQYNLPDPDTMS